MALPPEKRRQARSNGRETAMFCWGKAAAAALILVSIVRGGPRRGRRNHRSPAIRRQLPADDADGARRPGREARARRRAQAQGQLDQGCGAERHERRPDLRHDAFRGAGRPLAHHPMGAHQGQCRDQGRVGDDHLPALSEHAQSQREDGQGLQRQGQDRRPVGEDLDAGDHAADGRRQGMGPAESSGASIPSPCRCRIRTGSSP